MTAQREFNKPETKTVVLLHGLARTHRSMWPIEKQLQKAGFSIVNIGYPSRHYCIEVLVEQFVIPRLQGYLDQQIPLCFVTHSMGGILLRYLAAKYPELTIERAVMLAPPNDGSELVDKLRQWSLFKWLNGPAGQQLGTRSEDLPQQLGAVSFPVGVIAGNRPVNPLLSSWLPSENDGKVTVESTKVTGMTASITLPYTHSFLMNHRAVQQQVLHFIKDGYFKF